MKIAFRHSNFGFSGRWLLIASVSFLLAACSTKEALEVTKQMTVSSQKAGAVLVDWQTQHKALVVEIGKLENQYIDARRSDFQSRLEMARAQRESMCKAAHQQLVTGRFHAKNKFLEKRKRNIEAFELVLDDELKNLDLLIKEKEQEALEALKNSSDHRNDPSLQLASRTKDAQYFALIIATNGVRAEAIASLSEKLDAAEEELTAYLQARLDTATKEIESACDVAKGALSVPKFPKIKPAAFPNYEVQFRDLIAYAAGMERASTDLGNYILSNFTVEGWVETAKEFANHSLGAAAGAVKEKINFSKDIDTETGILETAVDRVGDKIGTTVTGFVETVKTGVDNAISEADAKLTESVRTVDDKVEEAVDKIGDVS